MAFPISKVYSARVSVLLLFATYRIGGIYGIDAEILDAGLIHIRNAEDLFSTAY